MKLPEIFSSFFVLLLVFTPCAGFVRNAPVTRIQRISTTMHSIKPIVWFQRKFENIFNSNKFETSPTSENDNQPKINRKSIIPQAFYSIRNSIAVLSLLLLLPASSFARSSQSRRSSKESSSPSANVKVINKRRGTTSTKTALLEDYDSNEIVSSKSASNDILSDQNLKYIGLGAAAVTVIISVTSDDDEPKSKSAKKLPGSNIGVKSPLSSYKPPGSSSNNNKPQSISNVYNIKSSSSSSSSTESFSSSGSAPKSFQSSKRLLKPSTSTSHNIPPPPLPAAAVTPQSKPITTATSSSASKPPTLAELQRQAAIEENDEDDDNDDLFTDSNNNNINNNIKTVTPARTQSPLPPTPVSPPPPPVAVTSSAVKSMLSNKAKFGKLNPSSSSLSSSTSTASSTNTPPPSLSKSIMESRTAAAGAADVSAVTPPRVPPTPTIPTPPVALPPLQPPPPPPAAKKQGGGILSRIFSKPGGNRDSNILNVLKTEDSANEYRIMTATILAQFAADADCFPELTPEGLFYDTRAETLNDSTNNNDDINSNNNKDVVVSPSSSNESDNKINAAAQLLEYIATQAQLTPEQAAESFAEVTSAMLVSLIDKAIELTDKKTDETFILDQLDIVTDFVNQAGGLYAKNYAAIAIDPVQYNGKAKREKVENLYLMYYKSTTAYEMSEMMKLFAETAATATDGDSGTTTAAAATTASTAEGGEDESNKPLAKELLRKDSFGSLQRALGLKEAKRNSLEQKVQKELMMKMGSGLGGGGGGGGGGGLGDMFSGALKGAGGSGGMPDMSAMMNGMPGMGGMGSGGMPGSMEDNPFKDMSQEEVMEATKQSLVELKKMLEAGEVTKEVVLEMEKTMGIDFTHFSRMMDLPGAKQNLKSMGPEMAEMMDMFKQLNKIKKSG